MSDQQGSDGTQLEQMGAPRIAVIGVGGAGGNAINNMIQADLEGVEFWVANTDAQALEQSSCESQIQLGANLTKGLGAGSRPEIGQAAAEEAKTAITSALAGTNMTFITAGMGGGTGTGGAPIIAQIAREEGVLTVGVVSKPFDFEGTRRMRQAEEGIAELSKYVDTLIVVPNQNLFRVADDKTTFADAFKLADEVLHSGVRGVTDLMVLPGLVNLDFADVRSIMAGMGKAVMGTGEAEGENRALAAAQAAISNPLLDDISMKGARSVLINITGGLDLMLMEVDEAANRIREEVDPDANIIFGSALSQNLDGKIRVSVIATGNDAEHSERVRLKTRSPLVSDEAESPELESTAEGVNSSTDEPAATSEEPLTLRLVSTLPGVEPQPDAPPRFLREQHDATISYETELPILDASYTRARDEDVIILGAATAPEHPSVPNSAKAEPAETAPVQPESTPETAGGLKSRFRRPAKPAKSESTLEAFENSRTPDADDEEPSAAEQTHFVVWEVDLGARIYKVPEGKLATIRQQPHADRLKLFDNLEKARAEAGAIFKRVAAERTAKGLPRSILEPTLEDLMRWDENQVPQYFL